MIFGGHRPRWFLVAPGHGRSKLLQGGGSCRSAAQLRSEPASGRAAGAGRAAASVAKRSEAFWYRPPILDIRTLFHHDADRYHVQTGKK